MDVTPMSMQMVVPRVSDAAQVQQNLNQAAAMQQDFEALREKEDAKLKRLQNLGENGTQRKQQLCL